MNLVLVGLCPLIYFLNDPCIVSTGISVSMIYVDEAAFFQPQEQENLLSVVERYIIKSNPWIILVSTPNKPDDIMNRIKQEEVSLYERLYFSYKVGEGKMWTPEEIEIQKQSHSFEREYNLSFEHNIGNIYNYQDIEAVTQDKYSLAEEHTTNAAYNRYMAIDPAFGSSEFGILICQVKNSKLEVCYADTISRPSFTEAVDHIQELIDKYPNIRKILIDGSSPGLVKELKLLYDDMFPNYEKLKPELVDKFITMSGVWICPISFSKNKLRMITHSVKVLEKHYIRIDKSFTKLLSALRSAVTTTNNTQFDKVASSYSDLTDCFQMISLILKEVS